MDIEVAVSNQFQLHYFLFLIIFPPLLYFLVKKTLSKQPIQPNRLYDQTVCKNQTV